MSFRLGSPLDNSTAAAVAAAPLTATRTMGKISRSVLPKGGRRGPNGLKGKIHRSVSRVPVKKVIDRDRNKAGGKGAWMLDNMLIYTKSPAQLYPRRVPGSLLYPLLSHTPPPRCASTCYHSQALPLSSYSL